ncbi:hypothetical protein PS838_00410 [Pseudomonas fluorescens]|jgi:hypothetical protein|nr:hypothetical protein PS838_00410 [Pseudomonas fluorescens]
MSKVTPDPPDTGPAVNIMSTPRTPCGFFIVNSELDTYASESLASANVMATDLVDHLQGTSRNALLGVTQVIMLGELAVNRALDRIESPK